MTVEEPKVNGNNPEVRIAPNPAKRFRASGPILILALLFVVASFLAWYFTWFGRDLADSEITEFLLDEEHPRHVQHALLQIQQRIERGDKSATQWYPQIIELASNPEAEFRLTAAWLMGADNTSEEFHGALRKLLIDPEPIVRRNAALALVRFNDSSGRIEIASMLQNFTIKAPAAGTFVSSLSSGAQISRGALLARIQQPNNEIAMVRSPLNGTVDQVMATNGHNITTGDPLLTLKPDEQSVWEALRALSMIGRAEDLTLVERYTGRSGSGEQGSERLTQQATLTANAIKSRETFSDNTIKR
ncbi:MAG: biotin/lipoyl-containing protein [Pyrinomonadaceae bacterium]